MHKPLHGVRPLVHSARGSRYLHAEFWQMLRSDKLRPSMARKGDCFDNTVAESIFGIMKREIDETGKLSAGKVRLSIFDFLEVFYNTTWRQIRL